RPVLGVALAALTALFALGCSSDDEPLTAEQAAALAAAGLLTEDDLPSSNWVVTEGSEDGAPDDLDGGAPTDADDLFANTEACRELEAAITEVIGDDDDTEETQPLAEASRSFDFGGDDQLMARSVQASVSV